MSDQLREGAYTPAFELSRTRLRELRPEAISAAALCRYCPDKNVFTITSLGFDFEITYPAGEVFFAGTEECPPTDWKLILLNHLSAVKEIPVLNQWTTYRELPGGNVFFPSISTYVLNKLGNFFTGSDKNILRQALRNSGFNILQHGSSDLAAVGHFAPRIPLMLLFWEGEEGIPSSCQLLFDRTLSDQMHIEDAAALCSVVRDLLLNQYEKLACQSAQTHK